MTIYFLQRLNPQVLPVLHETISSTRNPINANIHVFSSSSSSSNSGSCKQQTASEEKFVCDHDDSSSDSDQINNENDLYQCRNFDIFRTNVQAYVSYTMNNSFH